MEREAKAKVVASVWGAKFVIFLAVLAVLPQSIWEKRLNSTVSSVGRGEGACLHWELNQLWPYKDMLFVRQWSDAGPAERVRCCLLYIAESKKQGSKRFNCITKKSHLAYLVTLCTAMCITNVWKRGSITRKWVSSKQLGRCFHLTVNHIWPILSKSDDISIVILFAAPHSPGPHIYYILCAVFS